MDLWQGSWNNQVFTLSFHLWWVNFARKRAGEITCKCLRAGKSYEKSDTLYHRVWRSLQKWHAWLLSPLELPYCSQSKINSFNLFQGPYLQNRDFWESILWSQETKSIIRIQKHPNVLLLLEEEYSEKCLVPTVTFSGSKLFYRDEWVLKVWGSCALYQGCHEFTHYCVMKYKNLKQKMLPSPHSLHYGIFSAWQWRYSFSQGENPSVDMYFTQS